MHRWKLWAALALIATAILPSLGITLGIIPVLSGTILVIVAILGGYLLADYKRQR